ncbi:hypothetical protein HHI36_015739 [Cryptolaemus montrouzieri]|uniref:Uncharacterized protein n=1 Tax=Cryptolaemus montrouzieri TaxID=559131 RepID=A0ABD2N6H0_9CUCU
MKLALIVLGISVCALAVPVHEANYQYGNKQQDVWEVLKYIQNPIYHKEYAEIAETYSPEANAQHYKNGAYHQFSKIYEHEFLKKGEIFSIFNEVHVHQAEALFKLFYYADTYETFHQTALWARHHLNEGLFLYSYSVAIVHRPDTQGVTLPPIYELYPHYFFNSEVMQKAYQMKMGHFEDYQEASHQKQVKYIIHANYSGHYMNVDPEQSMSYYLEDVGINAFYFYFNLYQPYWMDSEEFHLKNRGETFLYLHQQLFARYHLERLSHGVGEVEYFNWDVPFKTGYYPSLTYPNGLAFPERPQFANLKEYFHHYGQKRCYHYSGLTFTYVQTYEQRIMEAIDSGFVIDHQGEKHPIYTEQGLNTLANLVEGNADSPNYLYYGSYVKMARHLLGYSKEPLNYHQVAPSALEHYSTSLRDPAFYQMVKKVLLLVDQYKQNLPAYQRKHLQHHDLEVNNVEVEPLVTYYDHFYADITNGLHVTPQEYEHDSFKVRVHQYRLNHKNFNYKVHVKSQKEKKVVVKVFMGPKYDEHGRQLELSQIHNSVFEMDHFLYELQAGQNVIKRNSAESYNFAMDQTSYYDVYKYIMGSKPSEWLNVNTNYHYGFPMRYRLPRGSEAGTSFQLYVIVYPYEAQNQDTEGQEYHANYVQVDQYPMGYPFDRQVEHDDVYYVPNAYVKHVKVYHHVNQAVNHDYKQDGDYEDQQVYNQYGGDYNSYQHDEEHQDHQYNQEKNQVQEKYNQVQGHKYPTTKYHKADFFKNFDYQKKYNHFGVPSEQYVGYQKHYYGQYQPYGKHVYDDQYNGVYGSYHQQQFGEEESFPVTNGKPYGSIQYYNQKYKNQDYDLYKSYQTPKYQQQYGEESSQVPYGSSYSYSQKYKNQGYGYHKKHGVEDQTQTTYQGYHGSNYQTTNDMYHHAPTHHYYSSFEQQD